VTNLDLLKQVNTNDEWIFKNLGIRSRRISSSECTTSDLATKAAENAFSSSGIEREEIDLIIVATATPDRKAPSTACIVKKNLKIKNNCPAFDIAAVCSGFMYAMSVASNMISGGAYKKALIIGADTFSKITDWTQRDCVFFGDGAGAIILEATNEENAFFSSLIHSECSNTDHFTVYPKDSFFTMNGKAVYDTATKVLPEVIKTILDINHLKPEDITHVIPHQPSIKILERTSELTKIPFEKWNTNMHAYANTSGATIPILLDEVIRSGKLVKNDIILFAGVGSGWTWGAGILRWL
jgi:3-oxoacyl-[acyl-carrier-protein] synthase-3